jgi:hypothetical protein
LAAAVTVPSRTDPGPERTEATADEHHGARDGRLAARQRSARDHAGRATGAGGGRSYAFRRS